MKACNPIGTNNQNHCFRLTISNQTTTERAICTANAMIRSSNDSETVHALIPVSCFTTAVIADLELAGV